VQQALETLSAAGTLVPVLPEYRFEPFEMFAVYPRSRRRQKRVRLFVDAAVAVF
jgi:DNA-binding transcriptional LysR family regulator